MLLVVVYSSEIMWLLWKPAHTCTYNGGNCERPSQSCKQENIRQLYQFRFTCIILLTLWQLFQCISNNKTFPIRSYTNKYNKH